MIIDFCLTKKNQSIICWHFWHKILIVFWDWHPLHFSDWSIDVKFNMSAMWMNWHACYTLFSRRVNCFHTLYLEWFSFATLLHLGSKGVSNHLLDKWENFLVFFACKNEVFIDVEKFLGTFTIDRSQLYGNVNTNFAQIMYFS